MYRAYKLYLVLFSIVVIVAVVIGSLDINKQKSHIYLIPSGYTGWIEIIYNQEDHSELSKESQAFLHNVPRDGILKTSSAPTSGGMTFYYVDELGARSEIGSNMIHGQSMRIKDIKQPDDTTVKAEVNSFFVGTKEQYNDNFHY